MMHPEMMDPKGPSLGAPLLHSSKTGPQTSHSGNVATSVTPETRSSTVVPQPVPKKAEKTKEERLTWDIRPGFGYDWLVFAMILFVAANLVLAKFIDNFGEKNVLKGILCLVVVGVVVWAGVGLNSFRGAAPRRGTIDLSGLPAWRLALFHFLNVLLYWQIFYTTGLSYMIGAGLFQAGVTPEDSGELIWDLLFPLKFGKLGAPKSWADLYAMGQDFIPSTIPFYFSSILTESILVCSVLPKERRPKDSYGLQDAIVSSVLGMLPMVSMKLWITTWGGPAYRFVFDNLRLTEAFNSPESVIGFWACIITADFFFYIYHRTCHIMSWMWTAHSVHHSSEEFNLTLGPRESFLDFATPGMLLSVCPMGLFFPFEMVAPACQLRSAWQFSNHLVLWPETPVIEYVFYTASLHRVHHARNNDRLGRNFGAIFSIWDRIFGSYEPEYLENWGGRENLYYGVIPQTNSWDPTWINFQFWHHMLGKQWTWDSWMAPFRHWTPPGGKCPPLGSKINPWEKYSACPTSRTWINYATFEGVIVVIVCSVAVNTPALWNTPYIEKLLGCGAAIAHLVLGFTVLGMACWSSSQVGQLFTGESETTLKSEVLRQVVLISSAAAYLYSKEGEPGDDGSTRNWQLLLVGYSFLRAWGIYALWRETPRLEEADDKSNFSTPTEFVQGGVAVSESLTEAPGMSAKTETTVETEAPAALTNNQKAENHRVEVVNNKEAEVDTVNTLAGASLNTLAGA